MLPLVVLLLAVGGDAAPPESPWLADYGVALRQARLERLPLLVVLENPDLDGGRITQIKHTAEGEQDSLLARYKLCRIDVSSEYGHAVAKAFKVSQFPYTAIIDNTGSVQIFRKTGAFSAGQWSATLVRYQDGKRPTPPVYTRAYYPSFSRSSGAMCFG
jgi:hypothetical protein